MAGDGETLEGIMRKVKKVGEGGTRWGRDAGGGGGGSLRQHTELDRVTQSGAGGHGFTR